MTARQGLPVLHELAARWTFRRRLLAAVGAEPDLFTTDPDDTGDAEAGVDRQRRHEIAAQMAGATE